MWLIVTVKWTWSTTPVGHIYGHTVLIKKGTRKPLEIDSSFQWLDDPLSPHLAVGTHARQLTQLFTLGVSVLAYPKNICHALPNTAFEDMRRSINVISRGK